MLGLQPWHLIVILAVALIIFGPSRLPELGKSLGKSIREFREAATTVQDQFEKGLESKPESTPETKTDDKPKA